MKQLYRNGVLTNTLINHPNSSNIHIYLPDTTHIYIYIPVESESNSHDVARGEDDHEDNNSDDEICDEEEEYYDVDTVLEADGNSDNKKHSWWSYLHPYSYFV